MNIDNQNSTMYPVITQNNVIADTQSLLPK